ncbi:hypothetical protein [Terribacillus saccharophilus]|uniref:hypothetical protein n=1 Tax=Terribacillus saccharophilus TaxID=361277 RepID=UPI001C3EEB55|nr:hypothetical protein [Terribacillus saccharophilus]
MNCPNGYKIPAFPAGIFLKLPFFLNFLFCIIDDKFARRTFLSKSFRFQNGIICDGIPSVLHFPSSRTSQTHRYSG